jgi:uncharacterized membrane protein YhhN
MARIILLIVALGFLVALLWAEHTGSSSQVLLFKAPLSVLFVVAAILQVHPLPRYYRFVLVGLVLGLVGDICLAIPGATAFRAGLVAFLAGHILYVCAFATLSRPASWLHAGNLVIFIVSGSIFWWLLPHLGAMLIPVTLYIVVISVMVSGAWAVFRNDDVRRAGAWVILIGAILFYVSDIFVARDRFMVNEFLNRLMGLPLYYSAQFLLAFSVGLVHPGEDKYL